MVDFSADEEQKAASNVSDLLALYYALDRKGSHVTPRPPQREALAELTKRRTTRDVVLKMSTGYGKTAVALVNLWSHMVESGRPVVYLCPTIQLVEQVLREAENLGMKATHYKAGQKHPDPEAAAGRAITVCTYDKLFNGHTTFNRADVDLVPYAIVLDDAHSGIQEVQDAFNIRIALEKDPLLYAAMLDLLRAPCKDHEPGVWAGVERQDGDAVIEVPFWLWAPLVEQARPLLEERYQSESHNPSLNKALFFKWPFLRNHLRWCRCLVSGNAIEILSDPPAIQEARPFARAERRLFMSATLSDDSALVRELGCDPYAANMPVVPASDEGVGERMILAPSLVDPKLNREWVMKVCGNLSAKYRVVVLTASERAAQEWSSVGASVALGDDVGAAVDKLKSGELAFVAFPQRYDGIDLPDDSCRILVLDGMPIGQSLADDYDRGIQGRTGGTYRKWIYRIEQGMGRAVRSQADYVVVLVTGHDLVNFLAKRQIVEEMGERTRIQLKASEKITAMAKTDSRESWRVVIETISQSLVRDPGWKSFYEKNVRRVASNTAAGPDARQIAIAAAEQEAQRMVDARDPRGAAAILGDAINSMQLSEAQKGWLLQRKANYVHDYDPGDALKIQAAAYGCNDRLSTPPAGVVLKKPRAASSAGALVLAWYNTFDHPNGALAELAGLKTRLSFDAKPHIFEQALMDVAVLFGATGSRPEKQYRRGPDNLWEWSGFSWVIEAKNERTGKLPKADSGQLHDAMQWFRESYPEREGRPILVARHAEAETDAHFPDGTRVLGPSGLTELMRNIEQFVSALVQKGPILWTADEVTQRLQQHSLMAEQFAKAYTSPLQ